jgi:hypothetical protein
VLPGELASRGVDEGAPICSAVATEIAGVTFEGPVDRAGAAAVTMGRFGT